MIRLLVDENINRDLVRGVLRRRPEVDFVLAQVVGLAGRADVLAVAIGTRVEPYPPTA
jgi:hypothetical protein